MSTDICTCPIRPGMSYDELMDEILIAGKNCCDSRNAPYKGWICSTLDKELARARADRNRNKWYEKRKAKEYGVPVSQVKDIKAPRKRTAHAFRSEAVDLDAIL